MGRSTPYKVSRATVRRLLAGWLATVGLLLLVALGMALRPAAGPTRVAAQIGVDKPAVSPTPVPEPGRATGTADLPPLPAGVIDHGDAGVTPAQPFRWNTASAVDRARALQCLTAAIYYEAGGESDAGERAVAQVVLNRVRHPAFPATVCGVVYQGSAHAGCQFSFACDGALGRAPSAGGWARAARAAAGALAGGVFAGVGLATHYHTYAVSPSWARSLVMTDVVGAHFFHRWKGYWGTAAAFTQRYAGAEPTPGVAATVAAIAGDAAMPVPVPMPFEVPPLPGATPVTAAPALPGPRAAAASVPPGEDRLPASGQILDRWKDVGQPLPRFTNGAAGDPASGSGPAATARRSGD
ncbi:cell wall hydrolase [uncultured Sphingomonas sp.]|uniref:cell wall hydrolase n=1 Tax=uncultured Sphingomonas sp. TaxID=158754 RepID=UPI0026243841|nr:cell wall hydrolase [uncultured Sphingomonas sp.]